MTGDALRQPAPRRPLAVDSRIAVTLPRPRDVLAMAAVAATFVGVASLFLISPITLEKLGFAYIDAGGGLFAKFHPATPLMVVALMLRCLAARHPLRSAWHLLTGETGVVLMLAATVVAGIFALGVDKTPVTPLADTFVLAVLVFLLLRGLDPALSRALAALVAVILVANAVIALAEVVRGGWHLIQVEAPPDVTDDPTKANAVFSWKADMALDWRAQALLGHPLVNGLVIGSFILCLVSRGAAFIPMSLRIALLGLEGASMLAFGARTALVLSGAMSIWLLGSAAVEAVGRGARLHARGTAYGVLIAGLVVVGLIALVFSGFADKTIDRFSSDAGSASTRLTMFEMLRAMPWRDLVFQPDKDLVATLQRVNGLEFGIESSWIGLILTYGIVVAALVTVGILAFWRSVVHAAGRGAWAVCLFYLVLVSVTASLSGKTTTFAMAVALVLLFVRRETPPRRPPGMSVSGVSVHGPS